jgi:tRNA A-37 threonylcarbamoyl transferase component Bud32
MNEAEERPTAVVPADPDDLEASGPDPLEGATLQDTYTIVRFLAEGGMGRVYEARHTRISTKRFAIKVLLSELKHSMDVRLRFRREAEAAASIDHPNVVGVHDFGYTPDGRPYLVSDFLEGRELGQVLADRKPLPVPLACSIALQLCHAIKAAHDQGVIHRDMKPANVFLVGALEDPQVKVLDFGLARLAELTESSATQTGMVMGTPSYMAPEQARGERADTRVDVYGVAAVLYACLTGRPPHEEDSAQQTIVAVMTREALRPRLFAPDVPPELEVVVQRAMANDPRERYATIQDLEMALAPFAWERFVSGPRLPSTPAPPMSRASAGDAQEGRGVRRRAAGWMALGGALLLIGAASAALGLLEVIWPGRRLLSSELLLVVLAVIGTAVTPAVLLLRWLHKRYWNNSARLVDLVATVRAPIVAGVFVYGLVTLVARLLDAWSAHVGLPVPPPDASGWGGWAPFLVAASFLAAVAAVLRQRLLGGGATLGRRIVAGPIVVGVAALTGIVLVGTGHRMSATSARTAAATAAAASPAIVADGAVAVATSAPLPSASAEVAPAVATGAEATRASDDELRAATTAGLPALTDLNRKHPRDPRVLDALARELAREPERASELLRVLDALFIEAPDKAKDETLARLVLGASVVPATSQRAIELMRTRMGLRGAEMLFDLVLAQPEIRPRAKAALDTAEVQRILSPELKVAYDLHTAPGCAARVQLLPEVLRDGDERAIAVLQTFTMFTKKGCGFRQQKPCPPACQQQVPVFDSAIKQIRARLAASKKPVAAPAPAPTPG